MIQVDADVLLIDEVLAVGDAAFQQKCADVFREMRDARARRSSSSPTTWTRSSSYCHRAMLLERRRASSTRRPERGRRGGTCALNFERRSPRTPTGGRDRRRPATQRRAGRGLARRTRPASARAAVEQGEPRSGSRSSSRPAATSTRRLRLPRRRRDDDRVGVSQLGAAAGEHGPRSRAGERVRVAAQVDNPLAPGRYFVHCGITATQRARASRSRPPALLDFVVFGDRAGRAAIVDLDCELEVEPREAGARAR